MFCPDHMPPAYAASPQDTQDAESMTVRQTTQRDRWADEVEAYARDLQARLDLNLAPSCTDCNAGAHLTSVPAINLLLAAIRIAAKHPWE